MAITKVRSLVRAQHVLELLMSKSSVHDEVTCFVDAYQNGREQGFQLWDWSEGDYKSLAFAEERRSDSITVYEGPYTFQGLSEKSYKNSRSFSSEQEAADHLFERAKSIFAKDRFKKASLPLNGAR